MRGGSANHCTAMMVTEKNKNGRADLQGEFLSVEQATAPRAGRTGTGVNWRLQVTRQLIASGDHKKKIN